MTTSIEWADETWNPTTGCTKVSPGCANCYIERTPAFRIAGRRFVNGVIPVEFHEKRLDLPLHWRKPRRVFVNSMSDLFHADVPAAFIASVFDTMCRADGMCIRCSRSAANACANWRRASLGPLTSGKASASRMPPTCPGLPTSSSARPQCGSCPSSRYSGRFLICRSMGSAGSSSAVRVARAIVPSMLRGSETFMRSASPRAWPSSSNSGEASRRSVAVANSTAAYTTRCPTSEDVRPNSESEP